MLVLSGALHLIGLIAIFETGFSLDGLERPETVIDVQFVSAPAPAPELEPPPSAPLPPEPQAEPPAPPPEQPPPPPEPPSPPPPEVKPPPPEHKVRRHHQIPTVPAKVPEPEAAPTPTPPPFPPKPLDSGLLPLEDHSLSAYKRQLWVRIERRKPRDIHSPGTVVVTFTLGPDGSLLSARLDHGSGDAGLDHAAIDAVAAAAPFPPPPPGLTPSQLAFSIPFQFR